MISGFLSGGAKVPVRAARSLCLTLLLFSACWQTADAASTSDDQFAAAERAHYAALCRERKDLNSCSDAVRWSPGDPTLVVALADALVRTGRLQEAIRDYQRAETLDLNMRGLDAKINAAEAKFAERRGPKKPAVAREPSDQEAAKRYSNADPETRSH